MNESGGFLDLVDQSALLEMILKISDVNEEIAAEHGASKETQIYALKSQVSVLTQKLSQLKQHSERINSILRTIQQAVDQVELQGEPVSKVDELLRLEAIEIPRLEHEYSVKQARLTELQQQISAAKERNFNLQREKCEYTGNTPSVSNCYDFLLDLVTEHQKVHALKTQSQSV